MNDGQREKQREQVRSNKDASEVRENCGEICQICQILSDLSDPVRFVRYAGLFGVRFVRFDNFRDKKNARRTTDGRTDGRKDLCRDRDRLRETEKVVPIKRRHKMLEVDEKESS